MQTQALQGPEKHLLRSRMLFSLGLFILLLAVCAAMAAQAVDGEGTAKYAWLAGVILGMVACVGFARITFRLGRDLAKDEKLVRMVPVMDKVEKSGRKYFQLEGRLYQVSLELFEETQRGSEIELHTTRGGFVFGLTSKETA